MVDIFEPNEVRAFPICRICDFKTSWFCEIFDSAKNKLFYFLNDGDLFLQSGFQAHFIF